MRLTAAGTSTAAFTSSCCVLSMATVLTPEHTERCFQPEHVQGHHVLNEKAVPTAILSAGSRACLGGGYVNTRPT